MIYFITDGTYTKIGVADDPDKRRSELQTGNPYKLEVVFTMEGSYELENNLHTAFDNWRMNGEWFNIPLYEWTEELVEFISTMSPCGAKERRKRNGAS